MGNRPVLLVHGAWHGAWCWQGVIDRLSARGIRAVAVDLPSARPDRHPDADLHTDADTVRRALDELDDVVLVGHSYGGAVVTEAGVHPHVRHVVYVAAFALDETESLSAAAPEEAAAAQLDHTGRPDAGAAMQPAGDGSTVIRPDLAAELFYNTCPDDVAADAIRRLSAQAMAGFAQSPAAVAWRHRPSTYAVCTEDNAVHPGLQRILAARTTSTVEWPTDHSPFLSQPDLVADLVAAIATG